MEVSRVMEKIHRVTYARMVLPAPAKRTLEACQLGDTEGRTHSGSPHDLQGTIDINKESEFLALEEPEDRSRSRLGQCILLNLPVIRDGVQKFLEFVWNVVVVDMRFVVGVLVLITNMDGRVRDLDVPAMDAWNTFETWTSPN